MSIHRFLLLAALSMLFAAGAWAETLAELTAKAEKGDAESQFNLGKLYMDGDGAEVKKDTTAAAKWLIKSSEQNYGEAQRMLAGLYKNGVGVDKDPVAALMWIKLAVANNTANADRLEKLYTAGLTRDQVAEATKKAADWKPVK